MKKKKKNHKDVFTVDAETGGREDEEAEGYWRAGPPRGSKLLSKQTEGYCRRVIGPL